MSVTVQEPRFTLQEKMLLIQARRRALAPRGPHGWLMSEATDPKNFGRFKPKEPTTDLVAKTIGEAVEAWERKNGEGSAKYLMFGVEKI